MTEIAIIYFLKVIQLFNGRTNIEPKWPILYLGKITNFKRFYYLQITTEKVFYIIQIFHSTKLKKCVFLKITGIKKKRYLNLFSFSFYLKVQ